MGKYTEKNSDIKEYAEKQFNELANEFGIDVRENLGSLLLGKIATEVELTSANMGNDFDQEKATNEAIHHSASDILENLTNALIKETKTNPYTDNKFESFMNAFFNFVSNISTEYKKTYKIPTEVQSTDNLKALMKKEIEGTYLTLTHNIINYKTAYKKKYDAIEKGKSSAMCTDMERLLQNADNPGNLRKIAAVYTSLKEKQNKNSIFTNWLNKRGYNERAALKNCETKLMEKLGCKDIKEFENLMKAKASQPPQFFNNTNKQISNENIVQQIVVKEVEEIDNNNPSFIEEEHGVGLDFTKEK